MSAKIVRRLHKLRASEISTAHQSDEILAHADGVLQRASVVISGRWLKVVKKDSRSLDLSMLKELKTKKDTHFQLPELDDYITSMKNRPKMNVSKCVAPTAPLVQYDELTLPSLPEKECTDYHRTTANLQQFESWVSRNLDSWLPTGDVQVLNACPKLYDLMIQYHRLASRHYSNNPEGVSIMILTMFELWVACDKVAVHKCQLLGEYAPEIPLDALQNLLLPRADQMKRLAALESYVRGRSSKSRHELAGLLLSNSDASGFAARYFDSSETLRTLRTSIEVAAEKAREAKKEGFKSIQATYERLDMWYEQEECKYETFIVDAWCDPPETDVRHMESVCKKCAFRKERDSLMIEVHELPLPEDPVEASVVIFELKVPWWFSAWRDSRSHLLQKVLKGRGDERSPRNEYILRNDPHLSSHYAPEQRLPRRLSLLSENKPQVNTHYRMKGIAAMVVSEICVANGLRYEYHDNFTGRFVRALAFDDDSTVRSCTYTLPLPELQGYIFRPARLPDGRPSNTSISNQSACPTTMSLEEYKELTSVPLGHHVQWANILLQLAIPGVDFRKEVTTLVFLQCIHQAGPPSGDTLREAHIVFHDGAKALDIVRNLDSAVERIKRNWESAQALGLFTSITTRVLSLNAKTKIACFPLLAKIRGIAMSWIHALRELAFNASTHEDRSLFVGKGVEVALVCASTFDVDDVHMAEVLSSTSDASMLIQAAVVVQQGETGQDWSDGYLSVQRLRFARLLHRCYKLLAKHNAALDDATKCSWSAYNSCATGWISASGQADYLIMTETWGLKGVKRRVQYDLLSGELLVNGMLVDQAPAEYHTQSLYKTLFGTATVEVMPATSKGFRFSTKRSFRAHEVQLGILNKSGKLIVQAAHDGDIIENVPGDLFAHDLPEHFVKGYVHWYNFSSGSVEFRPADEPWNPSSSASWTLQKTRGMGWRPTKDGHAVVGLQTPSERAISNILKPLASTRRIHCMLQATDSSLRVDIPTLRLSFTLTKGGTMLTSKKFRSMAVDGKQNLGTLVGFKNMLMLKA